MSIICSNCGQRLPDDAVFCTKCGTKVTVIRCTGCGAVLTADAKFCPNCGTPVENASPPVEPVAPAEQVQQAVEVRGVLQSQKLLPVKPRKARLDRLPLLTLPSKLRLALNGNIGG